MQQNLLWFSQNVPQSLHFGKWSLVSRIPGITAFWDSGDVDLELFHGMVWFMLISVFLYIGHKHADITDYVRSILLREERISFSIQISKYPPPPKSRYKTFNTFNLSWEAIDSLVVTLSLTQLMIHISWSIAQISQTLEKVLVLTTFN